MVLAECAVHCSAVLIDVAGIELIAACTKASFASSVVLSPFVCVVAVVPFGNAGVPDRFAAVPDVELVSAPTASTAAAVRGVPGAIDAGIWLLPL